MNNSEKIINGFYQSLGKIFYGIASVNVSPKGMDSLRDKSPNKII
jgi:hypothetical protein